MMLLGKTFAAAVAIAGLPVGMASKDGFEVYSPSAGMSVIAERTYTVKWTGNYADSDVKIDLYHCGSDCAENECGEWVTSLCPYGDSGCPDNEGDYDVAMPEPMAGTNNKAVYKVRVEDVRDSRNYSCSGAFKLTPAGADYAGAKDYTPGMVVTSPETNDMAYAGETYTVLFDYFNEVGSREGRFNIDLYMSDGTAGCGTYVTTVCDKPSIGCKDSSGDYNIVIPMDIPQGLYKIRVSPFEVPDVYGCSGEFLIVSDVEYVDDMSYEFSFDMS